MPATVRLLDVHKLTADAVQDLHDAVDVLDYKTLVFCCRKGGAGTGTSQVYIEHAAVLDESAFVDAGGGSFDLTSLTTEVKVYQNLLRYVRWRATNIAGSPQFLIDLVANEN